MKQGVQKSFKWLWEKGEMEGVWLGARAHVRRLD